MNIKFCYLYRDASNYKQFNQVIFSNPNQIALEKIQTIIRSKLMDECWFIAKHWNLPDLHFKEYSWDSDFDHEWHEFECVEESPETKTVNTSIEESFERINKKSHSFTPNKLLGLGSWGTKQFLGKLHAHELLKALKQNETSNLSYGGNAVNKKHEIWHRDFLSILL